MSHVTLYALDQKTVSACPLAKAHFVSFKHNGSKAKHLSLAHKHIDAKCLSQLNQSLAVSSQQYYLDLSGNHLGDRVFAEWVHSLPRNVLLGIRLNGNDLTDQSGIALAQLILPGVKLASLDLGDNRIGQIGIGHVMQAVQSVPLKRLSLRNNGLSDKTSSLCLYIWREVN